MPRNLIIYEKGRKVIVEVRDSRIASLIGEYHNRVKQFLDTGRRSFLKELPRRRFKDMLGFEKAIPYLYWKASRPQS